MEWRVFLPVVCVNSEPPGDVWTLLDQGRLSNLFLGSETRQDVYMSCTEGVGLKIRGRKELMEIKVRGDKHPCGAEEWTKILQKHTVAEGKELIKQAFLRELRALQESARSLGPCSLQSLNEALSNPWANKQVSVAKKITKGRFQGVSVEQCDITLSGDFYTSPNWRSICFESYSVARLEEVLKCPVKGSTVGIGDWLKGVPGSIVQGYPAFIMAASHDHSPTANMVVSTHN